MEKSKAELKNTFIKRREKPIKKVVQLKVMDFTVWNGLKFGWGLAIGFGLAIACFFLVSFLIDTFFLGLKFISSMPM